MNKDPEAALFLWGKSFLKLPLQRNHDKTYRGHKTTLILRWSSTPDQHELFAQSTLPSQFTPYQQRKKPTLAV